MSVLFLSHSSEDDEQARQLKAALEKMDYHSVFLDFDPEAGIQAGESWQAILYRRLRSCQALVALVTDNFLASKWCFAEVALARMQGKKLFGLRATPLSNDATVPALLSDRQLVDGRANLEDAVKNLVQGLDKAGLSSRAGRAWDRGRSPYPGFSAFTTDDWGVYFGRDAEIESGLEIIRGAIRGTASRLAMILGASGSGKSSLLSAGIVHRLQDEEAVQVVGPFRPGAEPLDELESSVASAFAMPRAPRGPDVRLGPWLRGIVRDVGKGRRHVIIAVDQFEELLGRPEGHDADTFLSLMASELADADSEVSFVGTLRSDQLAALQSHRVGRDLEWQSLFVGPLDESKLREIIEEPARLAELVLEKGLSDRLIADTRGVHALPLLALTLRRLWEKGGGDGLLELREYEDLGGIRGAVARVANDALAGVRDGEALEGLKEALLRMVRLDEQQNAVRQPIKWESTSSAARPLLKRLVTSRLLVRENGELQVAHEALFTAWDRLSDWINESRQALLVHRRVSDAARLWEQDRLDTDLWRGARLDTAVELRDAGRLPLDPIEAAFLSASEEARERALEEKRREERQRERLSRIALGRGLAYQALGEAEDRPQRGLLLAVEAARATYDDALPVTPAAETALQKLLNRIGGDPLADLGSKVRQITFEPGATRFAAGCEDGTIAVLSSDNPDVVERRWRERGSAVEDVALVGRTVVSRSADGAVCAWDTRGDDKVTCMELTQAAAEGTVSAFSAARGLVAVAEPNQDPVLHDLGSGARWSLEGADSATTALRFSPNGQWLVDGRESGKLVMWTLASLPDTPTHVVIEEHEEPIQHVVWAARAPVFVTTDNGNQSVRRWAAGDEPGKINLTRMQSSGSPILDLAVSPDGDLVAVGTWHSEAFCWSAADGFAQVITLVGHSSSIRVTTISPDGRWIVTASPRDNFALLWPCDRLQDGPQSIPLRGEDRWLEAVAFAPDGTVVAGSWAGTVRRWKRATNSPDMMSTPGADLNRYALSWDGRLLLTAGARVAMGAEIDPRGKMVDLRRGVVEPIEDPKEATDIAMGRDGRWTAVAGSGEIRILDRQDGGDTRLSFELGGWFSTLALDRSGRWLVAGERDAAVLFDLAADGARHELEQHEARLVAATFGDDGQHLLTADTDGVVVLWEERDAKLSVLKTWKHEGVKWCGFVCDGTRWVSGAAQGILTGSIHGADDTVERIETGWDGDHVRHALARSTGRIVAATNVDVAGWDLAADDPAASRTDLPRHEGYIEAIGISSDGRRAATSMIDGPVRLWDLDSPGNPVSLPREQSSVMLLEFVEEDRVLISGQSGGSLAFWDLDVDRILERAIKVAGRELTEEERGRFLAAS